ncbi:exported hypothetical protein [Candidatus Magnetomoraceae bacterium gMMP-15]
MKLINTLLIAVILFSICSCRPTAVIKDNSFKRLNSQAIKYRDETKMAKRYKVNYFFCSLFLDLKKGERVVNVNGKHQTFRDSKKEKLIFYYDDKTNKFSTIIEIPKLYTIIPPDSHITYTLNLDCLIRNSKDFLNIKKNAITVECRINGASYEDNVNQDQKIHHELYPLDTVLLKLIEDRLSWQYPENRVIDYFDGENKSNIIEYMEKVKKKVSTMLNSRN